MKRFIQNIQWIFIFIIVWVVLFEKLSAATVVSGLLVGYLSLFFTEKYLMGGSYSSDYSLKILSFSKYIVVLLVEIYKAGINTIFKVFSGKINPGVVDIESDLENDFSISILANSITLTPGTVTLDKCGNKLKVLWLDMETEDSKDAGRLIKKNLEKHLRKVTS